MGIVNDYLIDFDKYFEKYLNAWVRKNKDNYKDMDELEEAIVDVYDKWKRMPQKWLNGVSPKDYFYQSEDPAELITLLSRYSSTSMSMPDLLLDRIVDFGEKVVPYLCAVYRKDVNYTNNADAEEMKMLAIVMLGEIGSDALAEEYIDVLAHAEEGRENGDMLDEMLNALKALGECVLDDVLAGYEKGDATYFGKTYLMDILADNSEYDQRIGMYVHELYRQKPTNGLIAAYVAKCGVYEALQDLENAMQLAELEYIDYIEIRNAFEELGGVVEEERDFSGSPQYEALKELAGQEQE